MKRFLRLISLCAVPLALVTPAASACAADGAAKMHCAMPEMSETAEMGSMEMAGCHDTSVTSSECCLMRTAPDSAAALSDRIAMPARAPEAGTRQETVPPAARPALTLLADARCLHGLGRYTLFSSFLL